MERVRKGRWTLAYKLLRNAVVFPAVVCEICPAPCEAACQRAEVGDAPLNFRGLEAASIRYAKNRTPESYRIPRKEERVAVLGAGLAGLSCALNLAQKRYGVTVFERAGAPGGRLAAHPLIDRFREDFALQFSNLEVSYAYDTEIKSLDELSDYDAIYVATGTGGEDFGLSEGWDDVRFSTKNAKVLMGGGCCGRDAMQSIADGALVSKSIEIMLQTGHAASGEDAEERRAPHVFDHSGEPSAPRVIPADGVSYTTDEAVQEAERCMMCDCRKCMDACEVLASWSKRPQKIAMEAFLDLQANPPFSDRTLTREAYSCNLCGYCRTICPADIDMGEVFRRSRASRRSLGKYPEAFHDFWMRDMDFVTQQASCAIPPKQKGAYAFFPGCKLGGYTPSRVRASTRFLTERYGAGVVLDCCGAPAYWAGEEEKHAAHVKTLLDVWERIGNPNFVFACPYCEMMFERFAPEIGRISLYELLADRADEDAERSSPRAPGGEVNEAGLPAFATLRRGGDKTDVPLPAGKAQAGARLPLPAAQEQAGARLPLPATQEQAGARLPTSAAPNRAAVFDPCAAPRQSAAGGAVRRLAAATNISLGELPEQGRCCGFGGHMRAANPALYDEMTGNRAGMDETPYIVYCANCEDAFLRRGKDCIHAIDLAFGLPAEHEKDAPDMQAQHEKDAPDIQAQHIKDAPDIQTQYIKDAPDLQTQRDRLLGLKADLLRSSAGETFAPAPMPWDGVDARFGSDILTEMDENLILKNDVKEAIWTAEANGDLFYDPDDGMRQCSLVKPILTYWVQYRRTEDDAYEVLQVYSHRMHFEADV
jgi:Fe-S oxidoreductase